MVSVYRDHEPEIELETDARRLLDALHGRCPLALITDGFHQAQRRKVEALGIEQSLSPLIYTDQWGRQHWKPSDRAFRAVEQWSGLCGDQLVYIGDNPTKDFIAPRRLGWRTIRIRRPGGEHSRTEAPREADAHQQVESLEGLDL